ncbi:MAG TPA: hypothetical protein VGR19_04990 [Allosphingosinicella sp.]|nr:hypothetical protein [Allosphingosinicella sp.]
MFDQDRITFDRRTGRPQPPVSWKLTWFWIVYGWVIAAILLYMAAFAAGGSDWGWSAACVLTAVVILLVVHWRNRQVARAKAAFEGQLRDYERGIAASLSDDRHEAHLRR